MLSLHMDRLWLVAAHGQTLDRYAQVPAGVFLHFVACGNEMAYLLGTDSYLTRAGFNKELRLGRFQTYRPGDAYPDLFLQFKDTHGFITGLFDVDTLRLRERVMTRKRPWPEHIRFRASSEAAALQYTRAHAFIKNGIDSWDWVQGHPNCHLSDAIKPLGSGHIIVLACRAPREHTIPEFDLQTRHPFPYALNTSPHRRVFPDNKKRKFVTEQDILNANPTLVRQTKAVRTLSTMKLASMKKLHEDFKKLRRMYLK